MKIITLRRKRKSRLSYRLGSKLIESPIMM